MIFHAGDEAGQELSFELTKDDQAVEVAIFSDEQPQARVVELDREQVLNLYHSLGDLFARE
jgi:hypothetical protein